MLPAERKMQISGNEDCEGRGEGGNSDMTTLQQSLLGPWRACSGVPTPSGNRVSVDVPTFSTGLCEYYVRAA